MSQSSFREQQQNGCEVIQILTVIKQTITMSDTETLTKEQQRKEKKRLKKLAKAAKKAKKRKLAETEEGDIDTPKSKKSMTHLSIHPPIYLFGLFIIDL